MSGKKVLVVDDDVKVVEVLKLYLNRDGCEVVTANTGTDGLKLARETRPDLIVLDLMLPELDGFQVCRALRAESDVAIIMLTARTTELDRIAGLDLGADDYVSKPFSPRELAARIRAVLRRMPDSMLERGPSEIKHDDLKVNFPRREVLRECRAITLTPTEFRLLGIMIKSPGRVYSRAELISGAFEYDFDSYEHTVDTHIMNLRRKLEPDPNHPKYIITVFGMGYKFAGKEDV
ncbi:MAG: response regulator transcription factor [Chloroflexi bacterium]|nr:response regulator transcription factor [Chloroflexota bacterium]